MSAQTEGFVVILCQDCVYVDANGAEDGVEYDNVPMGLLDGYLVGPHYDGLDPDYWGDGFFSWGACDGCGTGLGGMRWEYLAVPAGRRKGE